MIIKIVKIDKEEHKDSPFYGLEERSIYLKSKDGEIVGLHAIGDPNGQWELVGQDGSRTEQKGFQSYEQWGNEYDSEHKMLGRGSFRVFEPIEQLAAKFIEDGWIDYEGPKQKEENASTGGDADGTELPSDKN